MIEARALVCVLLLAAILTILFALNAHGASVDLDIIGCSSARGQDRDHWSWREIDGRQCWYRGKPGRAKSLLRWSLPSPRSSAETGRPETTQAPSKQLAETRADPVTESTSTEESTWQPTPEDQLIAFTCCWPELATIPATRSVGEATRVTELPRATPPSQPIWPLIFLPVTVIVVSVLLAKRRLT